MRFSIIITIVVLAFPHLIFSQNKSMKVEEYLELGRDSIIQLAAKEIAGKKKDLNFHVHHFDRIRVMASKESIYVTFSRIFNFVPQNSAAYYGAYVNLTDRTTSYNMLRNPDDYQKTGQAQFYVPDRASKEAKTDIISVLGEEMIDPLNVYGHRKYYRIESDNEDTFYGFKINKATDEIFDEFHEHLEQAPDEGEEVFVEIK